MNNYLPRRYQQSASPKVCKIDVSGQNLLTFQVIYQVELSPDQLTQADVSKVECPECGAMRTVRIQGNTVVFPAHLPRVTKTPRDVSRWVKHGTTWTLSKKKA